MPPDLPALPVQVFPVLPALPVLLAALLAGTLAGLVTPRVAYRFSVAPGLPRRAGCDGCARPFHPGPAGWLRPGDRCPGCRARLGPSARVTTVLGALVLTGLAGSVGTDPVLPTLLAAAALGLVLGAVDLACLRLPDPLVGSVALLAGTGLTVAALAAGDPRRLAGALGGALLTVAAYLLLALLPSSRLGFGDVKLAAVLGLLLGWYGWRAVLLGLVLPHLLNGAAVLVLLATGRVRRDTPLPLGPALLAGALLAVLLR
ncbi:prepilin peptidase [Micromonospora sp. CPCC 206060]|uniref:prepilin peptidase n=1 Tax=Micromonospora sp. CPCC 206060 TaxID=3122406 RepID=UPI002FEF50A1